MVETQSPLPDNNDNNCDKTMANNFPKITLSRAGSLSSSRQLI